MALDFASAGTLTSFEEKTNSYSSAIRSAFSLANNKLKINDNLASAVRRQLLWTQ